VRTHHLLELDLELELEPLQLLVPWEPQLELHPQTKPSVSSP
jgi:hypothetical protein